MASVVSRKEVSSTESCGFVIYVLSYFICILYMIWTLVPDETLISIDITYFPPKSIALHSATFILLLFVAIPFLYATLNFLSAAKFDSLDTLYDEHSKFQFKKLSQGISDTSTLKDGVAHREIPDIYDIDVSVINRLIKRERELSSNVKSLSKEGSDDLRVN